MFHRRGEAAWARFITGRYYATSMVGPRGQQRLGNSGINTVLLGQTLAFATPGQSGVGGVCSGVGFEWRTAKHVSMLASVQYAAITDSSNSLRYGF